MKWVLLFLFSFGAYADCTHTNSSLKCVRFVRNYDGDTFIVNIPGVHSFFGNQMRVRIYGIDTPEIKSKNKCEVEAAKIAKKELFLILNNAKVIDLEDVKRDKYFRILAQVKVDGQDVAELMLYKALAYKYYGKTKLKIDWCKTKALIGQENE